MVSLLPAPFSCLYGPLPCPVGAHLHTAGEETTIYEALPCVQCRVLNETAAATFRRRPRLGQQERVVLTALAPPIAHRQLSAVPVSRLEIPAPRPAQAILTQSARLLARRALAVVTHVPRIVARRTGTPTLKDTVWIEATTLGAALITLPPGRQSAARSTIVGRVIADALAGTLTTPETLVHAYVDRLHRLLMYLVPTLQGLHPETQHRPRGQQRVQQCAIALQHLRRLAPPQYAAVMEQRDAALAHTPLSVEYRSTTGDDDPDRDEHRGRGSGDREN